MDTPSQQLGSRLRQEREGKGFSLSDIESQTKIRKRYLEALESGDWTTLPGVVYARGFVRNYAEMLGLDGLQLLHAYLDDAVAGDGLSPPGGVAPDAHLSDPVIHEKASVDVDKASENEALPRHPAKKEAWEFTDNRSRASGDSGESSHRVRPPARAQWRQAGSSANRRSGVGAGGQVAVVVGILVVLVGGWMVVHHAPAAPAPKNAIGNLVGTPGADVNGTPAAGAGNSTPANTLSGGQNGTASTSSGSGAGVQVVAEPFQANASPPTQTYQVTGQGPLSVVVSAQSGNCWVTVTGQNGVIDASETILQGQSKTWQSNGSLSIDLGNPSAVVLTVNGQQAPLPGVTQPFWVVFQQQQSSGGNG